MSEKEPQSMRPENNLPSQEEVVSEFEDSGKTPEAVEKLERLKKTLDYVVEQAEELGIQDRVYVFGGLVTESEPGVPKRKHSDVDIMVQGEQEASQLVQALRDSEVFEPVEKEGIRGQYSRQDFESKTNDYAYLDLRWVKESERNGIKTWDLLGIPEDIRENVLDGKHLSIPDSAFSQDPRSIGKRPVKYIYPEYTFLSMSSSPEDKRRFDKIALKKVMDKERLHRIREDATRSDSILGVTEKQRQRLNEYLEATGRGDQKQ